MADDWRYVCFAEPGGSYLGEVELSDVRISRVLSGPDRLTGVVVGDPPAWLRAWEVSVYAENPAGQLAGGGLLTPAGGLSRQQTFVDTVGRAGYPGGMPWLGEPQAYVDVDPMDVVRVIWEHLQSQPSGNLRVVVDNTSSPARVGSPEETQAPSGETGPFRLEWWSTTDLGAVIDKLALETPFDYLEQTTWNEDHTGLVHRLRLGYPTIGARRSDLRLVLDENIISVPDLTGADDLYASEVLALGTGTGRTRIRAQLTRPGSVGVRRVLVYTDPSARTATQLTASARTDLAWRDGTPQLDRITVLDHENAPIAALTPGDQVYVAGDMGGIKLDRWVRITEVEVVPGTDQAILSLVEV